jgi:hypothetical protein
LVFVFIGYFGFHGISRPADFCKVRKLELILPVFYLYFNRLAIINGALF